jgi:hypothetical protein
MMSDQEKQVPEQIAKLSEMLDLSPEDRAQHQLRILDGLFAKAIKGEKYESALKIMGEAREILNRFGAKRR